MHVFLEIWLFYFFTIFTFLFITEFKYLFSYNRFQTAQPFTEFPTTQLQPDVKVNSVEYSVEYWQSDERR